MLLKAKVRLMRFRFDRNMPPGCQKGGQGVEVVADDLGADVLLRCKPSQTGNVLEIEAMLDPFVSLLDAALCSSYPKEAGWPMVSGRLTV